MVLDAGKGRYQWLTTVDEGHEDDQGLPVSPSRAGQVVLLRELLPQLSCSDDAP